MPSWLLLYGLEMCTTACPALWRPYADAQMYNTLLMKG